MILNEWADTCLEVYKPNHKKGSKYYDTYRNRLYNCVLKYLGDMEVDEIKPIDCQKCINQQIGNSAYQISQTKQMMNFLFEHAIDNELINRNPARNITKPNGTKESRRALNNEERAEFLKAIEEPKYLPFAFMYYCGLRPSEARDIKVSDIVEINGCEAIKVRGTKTENAKRTIPIPSNLSRLIQNSLKKPFRTPQGYICKLNVGALRDRWLKLRVVIKAQPDLVPYCLRHTYCTDLMKKGIDIRVAQKLMGHSTIDLTSTIYSHFDEDLFTITFDQLNA